MKIFLHWNPDADTYISIEGNNADKVIEAAEKLIDFTSSATVNTSAESLPTSMPNNPKNKPK